MPWASAIRPMIGVSMAPPTIAITSQGAADLRIGPKFLQAQSEDGGKHQRHEEAGNKDRPQSHPARMQYRDTDQHNVEQGVGAQQFMGGDESHQVGGDKTPDAKGSQSAGKKVSGNFLGLVSVVLNILNEITPGSNLAAHV